jgi:uncharacterized protein (DUF4415 family)
VPSINVALRRMVADWASDAVVAKATASARGRMKFDMVCSRRLVIANHEFDHSDAPASPRDAVWTRPGALIPAGNKKQITVRLDADVLEFFKKTGTRYQSRINAALREYMKAHE